MTLRLLESAYTENHLKNDALSAQFAQLLPEEFYETIFQDLQQDIIAVLPTARNAKGKLGTYKKVADFDELMDLAAGRADVYVPPATFFNGCYRKKPLNNIYAFVVDIDYISLSDVKRIIKKISCNQVSIIPTAIVNSGNGLHMYYVLDKPLDAYHKRHEIIKTINMALQELWLSKKYKVDRSISIIQGFRVVGSLSKNGDVVKAFMVGDKHSMESLSKTLGVELWEKADKTEQQNTKQIGLFNKLALFPNGDKPFYKHCYFRIAEEVEIGHRYLALFALAIVAYKCAIRREDMESDIRDLADDFNSRIRSYKDRLKESEIETAMNGYSQRFVSVTSKVLEEWFGFVFPRKSKRNGRKRHEHLALAREKINERVQHNSEKITELINRNYSKAEIAVALNMSRSNLCRTYKHLFSAKDSLGLVLERERLLAQRSS